MSFSNRPFRRPSPPRVTAAVLAVGQRVYIARSAEGSAFVALTDDSGKDPVASLADGTEVEIRAWRPLGSSGTRYSVRSTTDGVEGWLAAGNLRGTRIPVSPPPSEAPAGYSGSPTSEVDSARLFGRHNSRSPVSPPAAAAHPASLSTREVDSHPQFGQRSSGPAVSPPPAAPTPAAPLRSREAEDSGRRFGQRSNY